MNAKARAVIRAAKDAGVVRVGKYSHFAAVVPQHIRTISAALSTGKVQIDLLYQLYRTLHSWSAQVTMDTGNALNRVSTAAFNAQRLWGDMALEKSPDGTIELTPERRRRIQGTLKLIVSELKRK